MSPQEKNWFSELTNKRTNAVNVLAEEGLINVFVSHIVDTYRESAHFVLELLQNADDVEATKVRFLLNRDGILFAHNGKTSFSISDPKFERKEGVKPGHINAITTFSLSTKKEDIENKIGKFGIGFKSVFQYTDTPHVYNYPYCFVIDRFMIPLEIKHNPSLVQPGETTAFWLPFDKENRDEAYLEISQKLRSLQNPLLFLRNLETVKIKMEDYEQTFTKKIKSEKKIVNNVCVQDLLLNKDNILKFETKVGINDATGFIHSLPISIGFIIKDGNVVCDEEYLHYLQFAWCFFPTKQETKLNYIVNAPFILTPNREALKEKRIENDQLIEQIGWLFDIALRELKYLRYITEEFFTTIPIPKNIPLEFRPIAEKIIQKLKNGEFIPTREGDFVSVSNAYVCSESILNDLLKYGSCLPLHNLTKNPKARLVFPERKLFLDQTLYVFFYQNFCAVRTDLSSTWFGGQFETDFLDRMPEEFYIKFFKYLIERSNSILGKGQPLWNKAFIPIENGEGNFELVKPLANDSSSQIFIDGAKFPGRYVVVDYLIKDLEIRRFLLNTLGARIPNDFDDFCASLEKYEKGNVPFEDAVKDFHKAVEYLKALAPTNAQKLYKVLKSLNFVIVTKDDGNYSFTNPSKCLTYFPKDDLKEYFKNSRIDFNWFAGKNYFSDDKQADNYKAFLQELHIQYVPYFWDNYKGKKNVLHGVEDHLKDISLEGSIYLMNVLIIKNVDFNYSLSILKTTAWLFDSDANKKNPNEIFIGKLHSKYPANSSNIHLKLGGQTEPILNKYAGLTDKEKQILETVSLNGEELSIDEIKAAIAEAITKKQLSKVKMKGQDTKSGQGQVIGDTGDASPDNVLDDWTKEPLEKNRKKLNQEIIESGVIPTIPNSVNFWKEEGDNDYIDNPGGFVGKTIVGAHYRETTQNKKKKQFEKEIEIESKRNRLIELAAQYEPYSFGWFKTLLELEDNFTIEDRVKRNPIRVVFSRAHFESEQILVLTGTSYIPPTIEDIGDLAIQIYLGNEKHTIKGEVISPKKQALNIKVANLDQLDGVDLNKVTQVVVEASTPDFILERLKNAFAKLNFEDTDNLKNKDILPSNLRFIFGPPGTGKTTYISWLIGGTNTDPLLFADQAIEPMMECSKRVLVLTPTNKAGDVLVERIMKNHNEFPDWLIRFGQTEKFENESVFCGDRNLKPWVYDKCTIVTTIARFPYDYFRIKRKNEPDEWKVKDFKWDVIIFDEASMISQAALLYTVFKAREINPNIEFYIGGDPFQIPPIIQFEYPYWSYLPELAFDEEGCPVLDENNEQMAWKQDGGSIYSFVGLMNDDSFKNPQTEPHKFLIHNLKKQYRSILPIGQLFSTYRYNGELEHHRTQDAIDNDVNLAPTLFNIPSLPLEAINVIKFPVKKYEGVYRVRTIHGSPYQLYSSIFTVELIRYIQENAVVDESKLYKIGIISPYSIQNNIISKLLQKVVNGPIEVVSGTVHGFQGDECNLIIAVLNPPRNINSSPRIFLNKKNILNVAISRAKDKLIILSPFDPEGDLNTNSLRQIRIIERLAGAAKENARGYMSYDIEEALWGSKTFIDDSIFPSTHQSVNIYTDAVKKYEARQDENAIDILLKKEVFEKKNVQPASGLVRL